MLFASGRLSVSDSSYFDEDFVEVDVAPEEAHDVFVRLSGAKADPAVGSIELRLRAGAVAEEIGRFVVDFGEVALVDRRAAEEVFLQLGDEHRSEYDDALGAEHAVQPIEVRGCTFLLLRPRGGDGVYAVHRLRDASAVPCGLAILLEAPLE
jgi:hypothetical protein